jgi:hypothetical protein
MQYKLTKMLVQGLIIPAEPREAPSGMLTLPCSTAKGPPPPPGVLSTTKKTQFPIFFVGYVICMHCTTLVNVYSSAQLKTTMKKKRKFYNLTIFFLK